MGLFSGLDEVEEAILMGYLHLWYHAFGGNRTKYPLKEFQETTCKFCARLR